MYDVIRHCDIFSVTVFFLKTFDFRVRFGSKSRFVSCTLQVRADRVEILRVLAVGDPVAVPSHGYVILYDRDGPTCVTASHCHVAVPIYLRTHDRHCFLRFVIFYA